MLQGEHSAILLTFIKLPFVIKIFVLSTFEWLFNIGFTISEYKWLRVGIVYYLNATVYISPQKVKCIR